MGEVLRRASAVRLPPKRTAPRSGIERALKREWPRHRKFVRSHACCIAGCEGGQIEFAHVRSAENAGTGIKPGDWNGISLCHYHHARQHAIGQPQFEREYGIDLAALAAAFTRASPDTVMKATLAEGGQ